MDPQLTEKYNLDTERKLTLDVETHFQRDIVF